MLNGKTAVITGGSRGIGKATALKLAKMGANIAIIYAGNEDAAVQTKTECEQNAVKAEIFQCNVADYNQVKDVVSDIKKTFGSFDILVNNAGITKDNLIAMMKEDDFDSVIDTNLKGVFNMIRHCTPVFLRNKGGKIINISSVVGIVGNPGQINYSASKAGIIGITKSTAKELAAKNITCNSVAPGYIATSMTKELDENNVLINSIPLKRAGKPEDVAEAVAFLASPAADYITGEIIKVDGGLAI